MSIFLDALANKNNGTPPIWMMRQAGRYHSHYRKIKERYSFEEICKIPEVASEVAIGPINDFGFDAGILFSDILFILEGIGYTVSFNPGPIIKANNNQSYQNADFLEFQAKAILLTKQKLGKIPLIGFVGGIATIHYFVNKSLDSHKKHTNLQNFLEEILEIYISNIMLQINAGVDAIAILDSKPTQSSEYWNSIQKIIDKIREKSKIPIIYYTQNCENHANLQGISCIGFNSIFNLPILLQKYSGSCAIQGTFDQQNLTLPYSQCCKLVDQYFKEILEKTTKIQRCGWINGLGHGILKDSLEENVRYFIKKSREIF
jgi:uroporphyrinogen decarboxylase